MIKLRNFQKQTILPRLIISFIIITVPLYLMGIGIYIWAQISVRNEIVYSTVSKVNSFLDNLEAELMRIKVIQNECLSDENLNVISNNLEILSNYEKTRAIIGLQNRLTAIKNSSIYVKNVNVHMTSINRIISADGGISDMDSEYYTNLISLCVPVPKFIYWDHSISMFSMIPGASNVTKTPPFIIEIKLSENQFSQQMAKFNSYKDSGTFILPINNASLITSGDEVIGEAIRKKLEPVIKGEIAGFQSVKINGKKFFAVHKKSQLLNLVILEYIPEEEIFSRLARFKIFLVLFPLAILFVIVVYSISTYKIVKKPIKKLQHSFKQVEGGDFNVRIEHGYADEFRDLYGRFNFMVEKINTLIDQVYKQKIMAQKAELKQLQSQINPHFLYNSFFIINTMARLKDYTNVGNFTQQLGEYFQFITRNASEEVSMEKEINHARTYAEIQALRFSRRIKLQFNDLPAEYRDLMVPRLILQPVIENAVEHGLDKKLSEGHLHIGFQKQEGFFYIIVEDNGEGVTQEELFKLRNALDSEDSEKEITGMINIHRRIKLKYGSTSGVLVDCGEEGGLKITIRIMIEGGMPDCIDYL